MLKNNGRKRKYKKNNKEKILSYIFLLDNIQMTLLPWAGYNATLDCFGYVKW